jgi:hypothetical protein
MAKSLRRWVAETSKSGFRLKLSSSWMDVEGKRVLEGGREGGREGGAGEKSSPVEMERNSEKGGKE